MVVARRSGSVVLLCLLVGASGRKGPSGRPQLSINVKDGDFSGLGGLEPALSWEGTSKYGDMDLDYGIDVAAQSTSDLTTIPRRLWGRARQRIANWDVAARADLDGQSGDSAKITIDAGCDDLDLALKVDGSAGLSGRKDVRLHRLQLVKGLENEDGNRLIINPRYDLLNREADVVLAWKTGDINVEVTASADTQRIKLSKKIDEDNWVSPSVDSKGDVMLEWDHKIDDQSSFTTSIRPQEAIDVKWKDKEWTASVNMPIDGQDVSGANVHIAREVKF